MARSFSEIVFPTPMHLKVPPKEAFVESHHILQFTPAGAQRKEQCCLGGRIVAACPGQLPLKPQGEDGDIIIYLYHHTQMTKIPENIYLLEQEKEKPKGEKKKKIEPRKNLPHFHTTMNSQEPFN